ncbi:MAG: nucleotide exchange factor GrpE [Bacteroidales bacterium]
MKEEEEKKQDGTQNMSDESVSDRDTVADHEKKSKKIRFRKDNREEELQKKVDDLNDKYLRLFAEFDNFRKRTAREKSDLMAFASEDILASLLPVIDDFDRAVISFEKSTDIDAIREGVVLINNKLHTILEQKGLTALSAVGNDFNTDFHEAITSISAPEEMKGKVVDEIQKGYTYKGKIIRYAKVVVGN